MKINGDSRPALRRHTAQIYEDALYAYGGRSDWGPNSNLWKFDLGKFDFKNLFIKNK